MSLHIKQNNIGCLTAVPVNKAPDNDDDADYDDVYQLDTSGRRYKTG